MATEKPPGIWPHPKFIENTNNYPTEELWKYIGQHIVWDPEGTKILAGAKTREELRQKLETMAFPYDHVVWDYVEDPNIGHLT